MPVEDRLRRDEEWRLPLLWDEAGEQGDQCPVRPGEAGSADLASKDCHLVAQHEDLGVLAMVSLLANPRTPKVLWTSRYRNESTTASSLADSILAGQGGSGQFQDPSG